MSASHDTRIKRLRRLEGRMATPATATSTCLSARQLLELLAQDYGSGNDKTRLRLIQGDLKALVADGRIEVVNPGGKPLRYRRCGADEDDTPLLWQYTREQIQALLPEVAQTRQINRLWERLLSDPDGPVLDERRLRIVPDTLRLQPVELDSRMLLAVLTALAQQQTIEVLYQNARGERSKPCLHPQALVQRGPIAYLLALKNDEDAPVRLYALHRMIRARLASQPSSTRQAEGFDLDEAIRNGSLDFGQGEHVDLQLRVRGYLTEVVQACPLAPDQHWEDEPEESDFAIRVSARLPSTGQLLRWLLGAGDNVEVIAPPELRQTMAVQTAKMARLYREQLETPGVTPVAGDE